MTNKAFTWDFDIEAGKLNVIHNTMGLICSFEATTSNIELIDEIVDGYNSGLITAEKLL